MVESPLFFVNAIQVKTFLVVLSLEIRLPFRDNNGTEIIVPLRRSLN